MPKIETVCILRVNGRTIHSRKFKQEVSEEYSGVWLGEVLQTYLRESVYAVASNSLRKGGKRMAAAERATCDVCGKEFDADELNEEGLCEDCEDASYDTSDDDDEDD